MPALFDKKDGIVGGAERYVFELARHMATVTPTSLVSFGAIAREESVGPLRIVVIGDPWFIRGQRTNPFSLRLLNLTHTADIVHCHQQHVLASTIAAIASRLRGQRVFCTELGGGGWDVSAYVSTDRLYMGHLHISEYSRRIAGQSDKRWSHVIWGGVDTSRFSPADTVSPDPAVTFVGRLLPHKGVDGLLRALPPELPARVIGPVCDASYLAHLTSLAAGKLVHFQHDCDDDALVAAYRSALCVVLPSVYDDLYGNHTDVPELLGQTLLEGMACGVPGVCTDVASLPEVVEHEVTGFVVPASDPEALRARLLWLAAHGSVAHRMGAAARARVMDRFTWHTVVQRCLGIYESCGS